MRVWIAWAVVACGCGRFGFGSTGDDAAAATGDGARRDGPGDGALASLDAPPCLGTTHTVVDNFDDGVWDSALWGLAYEDVGSSHVETGGRLEIHIAANQANSWAGYVSTTVYELKDDRAFVEVPVVNALDGDAILLLWTSTAKTDGPSIEYEVGRLVFRRRIATVINDLANITYDSTMHRWWQIREKTGMTYFETSADGVTWMTRYQEPTPGATTALITLSAGANNANSTMDLVVFDNFNGGGAPPACP